MEPDERLKNFAWIGITLKLAMDDITKIDEVMKKNFIMCMNILLYWKILDKDVRKRQRLMNNKMKLKMK